MSCERGVGLECVDVAHFELFLERGFFDGQVEGLFLEGDLVRCVELKDGVVVQDGHAQAEGLQEA